MSSTRGTFWSPQINWLCIIGEKEITFQLKKARRLSICYLLFIFGWQGDLERRALASVKVRFDVFKPEAFENAVFSL